MVIQEELQLFLYKLLHSYNSMCSSYNPLMFKEIKMEFS